MIELESVKTHISEAGLVIVYLLVVRLYILVMHVKSVTLCYLFFLSASSLIKAIAYGTKDSADVIAKIGVEFGKKFLACGTRGMQGFHEKNVTPYIHLMTVHAAEFVRQFGGCEKFSGQSLERLNDEIKRGTKNN